MKHYTYLLAVSLGLFLTSCADDLTENLAVQNVPLSVQVMEELNSLDPLKSYKTASNISPNFKLGAALKASDLAAGGNVSALAAANFDEVVDADIMQYAACVGEDGTMNFSGVTDFVETARKAGVGVYGQSLVSHRNQQVAYLSKLIADREPSTEDLVPIEKPYDLDLITNSDCEGNNENYYANDPTEGISTDLSAVADDPVQGKCMVVNSADQAVYSWDSQFFIKVDHVFKAGEKAKLTMKIKADVAQSADGCQAHGDKPGAYKHWAFFANPDFTTEWADYVSEITIDANQDGAQVIAFNLCKGAPNPDENAPKDPGPVTENRYYFDDIQIHVSGVDIEIPVPTQEIKTPYNDDLITNSDCEGNNENYYANDPTEGISTDLSAVADDPVQGKCMVVNSADQAVYSWDSQFFIKVDHVFKAGEKAKLTMKIKADVAQSADGCQAHGDKPGAYKHWAFFANPDFTTEWADYVSEITIDANQDGAQVIAFNLCKGAPNPDENAPKDPGPVTENRYYFDDIQVNVSGVNVEVIEAQKIPLTAEEKRDTLIWAMNNWIEGMMSAAGEYIQAWNVINEPIANEGDDGNGNYPLIHAGSSNGDAADAFFWQDNMGDLEYVRTAVEAARKSYKGEAADLKLFVNDYNLNNDADDNKKCKSLIAWIEKWEADGKTKIDGIGTELHLTCYEDAATNTKKQESITKMFELLAASKKLVKVTALDIDFQDKSGKSLQVHELTDAQQQQMADLYKFVIKTYLDKVPAAQQYGICQWSVTDSGNMPKGLWTDQFRRKLTFKGFAEGLSGK